jgi:hypothetical protein
MSKLKRQYNATFRAKSKGLVISGRRREILIYFDQISQLILIPEAKILVHEFGFKIKENRQLKLHFPQ